MIASSSYCFLCFQLCSNALESVIANKFLVSEPGYIRGMRRKLCWCVSTVVEGDLKLQADVQVSILKGTGKVNSVLYSYLTKVL